MDNKMAIQYDGMGWKVMEKAVFLKFILVQVSSVVKCYFTQIL